MEREREILFNFAYWKSFLFRPKTGREKKKGKRGRGNKRMEGNTDQSEYRPDDDGQSRM